MRIVFLLFCFFLVLNYTFCSNLKSDSLLIALKILPEEEHAEIYNTLSYLYLDSAGNTAISFAKKAIILSEKHNLPERQSYAYIMLGSAYLAKSDYKNALEILNEAITYAEAIGSNRNLHTIYNNIGVIYRNVNQPEMALEAYSKALEFAKITNDPESILQTYNNTGNVYASEENYVKALEYFQLAKEIGESSPDFYDDLPSIYNNIGWLYEINEDYDNAINQYQSAYFIFDSLDLNWGKVILLNNLAGVYIKTGNLELAESKISKADSLHKLADLNESRINLYRHAYTLYSANKNFELAIDYLHKYYQLKDSVYSRELDKFIYNLKTEYEVDKMQAESDLKQAKLVRQQTLITGLIIIIITIAIFTLVLIKLIRDKSKLNYKLQIYNKDIIAKNNIIKDNLIYARHIQNACMEPAQNKVDDKGFFVLNLPKKIVGGDFYMVRHAHNSEYFILADCTGHGISGGFLSVLAIQYIDIAISKYQNTGDIMNNVNMEFYNYFSNNETLAGESLCISIIRVSENKVYFSGSKHKVWIVEASKGLSEIKSSSASIGSTCEDMFTEHELIIDKKAMLYLSSDGYPDQFGGNENKKLKYPGFREIIKRASGLTINNQKEFFNNEFINWKAANNQTDDVILMGVDMSFYIDF